MNEWTLGITGGSGYLGSSLAMHLGKSFDIKLLDIRPPQHDVGENVSFQQCDVRDYNQVKNAVEDVDLVIHTSIIQIPAITEQKRLAYEVNLRGTDNVCQAVDKSSRAKGMILSGSWHTVGERGLIGVIDEEFGFRPDKVEDRARLYVLAKMAQETMVRFHDEMSKKIFGIIRMGTILGEGMPDKTAANIFIENGLNGKPLTPFSHSMYRPILYVDLNDTCVAYENLATKIIEETDRNKNNSLDHVFNLFWPKPINVYDLAVLVRNSIFKVSKGKIQPEIIITNTNQSTSYHEDDKKLIKVNITKALNVLNITKLKSPKESIEAIVDSRFKAKAKVNTELSDKTDLTQIVSLALAAPIS
jgi:UDP-glucose 4-epimerase